MEAGAVNLPQFKIAVLGSEGCGKKEYIKSLVSKQIQNLEEFINAQKNKPVSIQVQTNQGPMQILLQYIPAQLQQSQNSLNQRNLSYLKNCHAAVLMFQVTSRSSYKDVPLYFRQIIRVIDNIPICLVGNKVDMQQRKVKAKSITFHRKKNLQYYQVSSTKNYNVLKPLIWLLRRIMSNPQFQLLNWQNMLLPKEVTEEQKKLMEQGVKQMQKASMCMLAQDSDEF